MSNLVIYIILLVMIFPILRNVFSQIALWQQKEYRWDRMREYLKLSSAQKNIFSPLESAKWLLLFLALSSGNYGLYIAVIFAVMMILENIIALKEIRNHLFARPVPTKKAILLTCTSLLMVFFVFLHLFTRDIYGHNLINILIIERFVFVSVLISVLITFPFSLFFKGRTIASAAKKRKGFTELVTIGITGSYGKSSTKNILSSLLNKEDTAVTPGNTNTEIGVANFILKNVTSKTKFLVAEMGAYKIGEIKRLTTIAKPKIGIITAVTDQHLGLFGSLDNIKKAKYELVQALPADGVAIFNADDSVSRELSANTKHCKVLTYGVEHHADIMAKVTGSNESGVNATLSGAIHDLDIFLPLFGEYQISNALAAIAAAYSVGVTPEQIKERISHVMQVKGTMNIYEMSGALIVDDSYNANTAGVIAAAESLKKLGRKNIIIVLAPLIELGDDANKQHELIGSTIVRVASKVIYTSHDYSQNIKLGMQSDPQKFVLETNPEKLIKLINHYMSNESVILLEGRVPRKLREYLASK